MMKIKKWYYTSFIILMFIMGVYLSAYCQTDSIATVIENAEELFENRKYDSAFSRLNQILSRDSNNYKVNVLLGKISSYNSKYDDALQYFNNALITKQREGINDLSIYNSIGWLYHLLNNDTLSERFIIQALDSSVIMNDTILEKKALNNFGMLYYSKNDIRKSEKYFKTAKDKYNSALANEYLEIIPRIKNDSSVIKK